MCVSRSRVCISGRTRRCAAQGFVSGVPALGQACSACKPHCEGSLWLEDISASRCGKTNIQIQLFWKPYFDGPRLVSVHGAEIQQLELSMVLNATDL